MTEQTQHMKPFCIGRYVVDVPPEAEMALGLAKSDGNSVEQRLAFTGTGAYEDFLRDRERALRSARHDTEGHLLRSVHDANGGAVRVFVSRPEADDEFMNLVETYVHLKGLAYRVHYTAGNRNVQLSVDELADIANKLTPRDPSTIPTTPGACIKDGLLNRVPKYGEEFRGGAQVQGPGPTWSLSIATETSGRRDPGEGLLDRSKRALEFGEAGASTRILRKGLAPIDGRKGEEFVAIWKDKGVDIFDARLEVYGDGTPQRATLKLHFESGSLNPPDPKEPRTFLTHEEAMALWDAMVKSVRLRPGAF